MEEVIIWLKPKKKLKGMIDKRRLEPMLFTEEEKVQRSFYQNWKDNKNLKYSESLFTNQNDTECFECGSRVYVQRHEIFFGRNRSNSIKYGCWVNLCMSCHDKVHFGKDPSLKEKLQKLCQRKFETRYGRDYFMKVFGKNYL